VRALILSGGDRPDRAALDAAHPGWDDAALVIAADSGARHAAPLGLRIDLAIGDFDSLDAGELAGLAAAGARVERHPPEKDATDTELALLAAIAAGATEIAILAAWGGRADQALGTALLLAHPRVAAAGVRLEILDATSRIRLLRATERLELRGAPGSVVSLLPLGGDATVSAEGLRWPLDRATLRAGESRGLSNLVVGALATVRVHQGALLVSEGGAE
jgi:thiamine pyrophosphokinase